MDPVTVNSASRPSLVFQSLQPSTSTTMTSDLIPLSVSTDLLDSLIPPPSSASHSLTRSPLPPIGFEVNGGCGMTGLAGPASRVYSPFFDDFFAVQAIRTGPEFQMEKFESQIRAIASDIQSTVQMHVNGLLARKENLLQQLETIKTIYKSILMQNHVSGSRRPAAAFLRLNGSSLLDRLDCDADDGSGLFPLPNISFTKPDHALYKAITSMGFLSAPAFAPYCSASGEGLEAVVPGHPTSFVVVTKNCFNDELLIGRENISACIFAFSDPSVISGQSTSCEALSPIGPQSSLTASAAGLGSDVMKRPYSMGSMMTGNKMVNGQHPALDNQSVIKTPVSCSVVDHNSGKYTVTFTVPVLRNRVDHVEITVLVNGMAMSGCPFKVGAELNQRQTWKKMISIGSEGNQVGQFCRPWGVAISRMPANLSLLPQQQQQPQAAGLVSLSNNGGQTTAREQEHSAPNSSSPQSNSSSSGASIGSPIAGLQHFHLHDISPSSTTGNGSAASMAASSSSSNGSLHNYLIAVADRSNNRIQVFKFDAATLQTLALSVFGSGPGTRQGQFDRPAGLCFNTNIGHIVVADKDNHRIQVFDLSGRFLFKFGEKGNRAGQFCYPWDVESCPKTQQLVVSDTRNRRIQLFTPYGQYMTHFSQPLDSPRGVAFLGDSKLVVSDFNKHRLLIFDRSLDHHHHSHHQNNCSAPPTPTPPTNLSTKFIGFGEGSGWGEFLRPQGIAISGSYVFCSDSRNNRICLYNLVTQAFEYLNEDLGLDRPSGIAVIDSLMVVVDFGNNRLQICRR